MLATSCVLSTLQLGDEGPGGKAPLPVPAATVATVASTVSSVGITLTLVGVCICVCVLVGIGVCVRILVGICIGICVGVGVGVVVGVSIGIGIVVTTTVCDSELGTIVLSTTLSNWHEDGLMVAGRSHSADTVGTSGETTGGGSSQQAVAVSVIVDTLEEGKSSRVRRSRAVDGANALNSEMSMADNLSALESLGSRIVGGLWVGERASNEILGLDGESDILVGRNGITRLGVGDDSRDHVGFGRNITHDWRTISYTTTDLA